MKGHLVLRLIKNSAQGRNNVMCLFEAEIKSGRIFKKHLVLCVINARIMLDLNECYR